MRLGYDGRLWDADDEATYAADVQDGNYGKTALAIIAGMVLLCPLLAWLDSRKWRKVGVTDEERVRLRHFITAATRKDAALVKALDEREVDDGSDWYLDRLRQLYVKLADKSTGQITRASWDAAGGGAMAAGPDGWGDAAWEDADARDAACLLFSAADLGHDEVLTFAEFCQLAVLSAEAGAGDVDAQADILFMLVDEDRNRAIEHHELRTFCHRAKRWGLCRDVGKADDICDDIWHEAYGDENGIASARPARRRRPWAPAPARPRARARLRRRRRGRHGLAGTRRWRPRQSSSR